MRSAPDLARHHRAFDRREAARSRPRVRGRRRSLRRSRRAVQRDRPLLVHTALATRSASSIFKIVRVPSLPDARDREHAELFARQLAAVADRVFARDAPIARKSTIPPRCVRASRAAISSVARALARALQAASLVAPLDVDVLITGPSGTGTAIARAIANGRSTRRQVVRRRQLRRDSRRSHRKRAVLAPKGSVH